MDPVAIALVLLGIACMGGNQTTQRYLQTKKIIGTDGILVWMSFVSCALLIAYCFAIEGTGVDMPNVFWIALGVGTVANLVLQYLNVKSRGLAEVSLTAPIAAMTPLLVTLSALLLHEQPSVVGWMGIVLIAVGTWVHGRENAKTLVDYLKPFALAWYPRDYRQRSAAERTVVRKTVLGIRLAYLSSLFATVGLLTDGLVARSGSISYAYAIMMAVLGTSYLVFAVSKKAQLIPKGGIRGWVQTLSCGVFFAAVILLVQVAFRYAPIAEVGGMKRLSVVVVVFMAWYFLGETKAIRRLWPSTVVVAGAICITADDASTAALRAVFEAIR